MTRTCDGTDPNLLMWIDPKTGLRLESGAPLLRHHSKPCDCGLVFDDVRRSTIYPHNPV